MKEIDEIVNEAANKVKQILLEEAKKLNPFPEYCFGTQNKKYATRGDAAEGLLGSVDVSSKGIALPRPGILVFDANRFWTNNCYVLMLPDGMYEFRASMFLVTKGRKPTNICDSAPDWRSKTETSINYLVHGDKALYLMREINKQRVK